MAFTYDVTTDRGKVRLLATDINASAPQFQDNEIDAFLALAGSNIYRAGAFALQRASRAPRAWRSRSLGPRATNAQCLKRKAMYEKNLEMLENQALNLEVRWPSHFALPRLHTLLRLTPSAARCLARALACVRNVRGAESASPLAVRLHRTR